MIFLTIEAGTEVQVGYEHWGESPDDLGRHQGRDRRHRLDIALRSTACTMKFACASTAWRCSGAAGDSTTGATAGRVRKVPMGVGGSRNFVLRVNSKLSLINQL